MWKHNTVTAGLLRHGRRSGLLLGILSLVLLAGQAQGHFTHFEPRIIHLSPLPDGVQLLVRMPLPLLLLDRDWQGSDSGQAVPFTRREREGGQWRYAIAPADFEDRFKALEQRVLTGYTLKRDGRPVERVALTQVHLFNSDRRKPFSTLAAAEAAFGDERVTVEADASNLFDSGIDLRLFVPGPQSGGVLTLESDLGVHLNAIERLANILQVHDGRGDSTTYSSIGVLELEFALGKNLVSALYGQLQSGVIHILAGLDHVLFVLLIVLASRGWRQTLLRATAFTLGHSVTLALGVAGYVPLMGWFIPLIETLIALTIVYGGVAVSTGRQHRFGLVAMLLVGLIHGFGFSIVLSELVSESGGLSLFGLIAFNLGIEFGQVMIYAAVALVLLVYRSSAFMQRWNLPVWVSSGAVLISLTWIYERGGLLLTELQPF